MTDIAKNIIDDFHKTSLKHTNAFFRAYITSRQLGNDVYYKRMKEITKRALQHLGELEEILDHAIDEANTNK